MARKHHRTSFIYNIKTILALGGIVFLWRGIWGLMDIYFFPSNPELSYLFSALIGIGMLWLDDFSLEELSR